MNNKLVIYVLIMLLGMTTQVSYAGLIILEKRNGSVQIMHGSPIGQTFTAEDRQIDTIAFYIFDYNNPGANPNDHDLTAELYSGVGNNGTLIASNTVNNIMDGHVGWLFFDFSSVSLSVGDMYSVFVIDDDIRWGIGTNNNFGYNGEDYEGGNAIVSGELISSCDLAFMVVPIPEPVTLSFLALGASTLLRRRKT